MSAPGSASGILRHDLAETGQKKVMNCVSNFGIFLKTCWGLDVLPRGLGGRAGALIRHPGAGQFSNVKAPKFSARRRRRRRRSHPFLQ